MRGIQHDDLNNSSQTVGSLECGKGHLPRLDLVELIFGDLGFVEHDKEHGRIRLTRHTGETVTFSDHKIEFAHGAASDHEIMKRAISLAGEHNSDWTAYGSLDFQRTAVACGYAYGLNITATDEAQFTAKDWAGIKNKPAEINEVERRAGAATGYDLWKCRVVEIGDVPRSTFSPQRRHLGPAQT